MTRRSLAATAAFAVYVATVLVANAVTSTYGLVPVGFGLTAAAGTYTIGLALGLRDALQDAAGYRVVLLAIAVAGVLSYAVADARIATASGVAFVLGELLDLALYSPLRRHGWARAVVVSNLAGAVLDSAAFLALSGFGLTGTALAGQLVGKAWATAVFVALGLLLRSNRREVAA